MASGRSVVESAEDVGEDVSGKAVRSAVRDATRDLEGAADELLRVAGFLGRRHGVYTRAQLCRRARLEKEQEDPHRQGEPHELIEELVARRIEELIEVVRLTPLQEVCFRLRVDGLSVRGIARWLGVDHRLISRRLAGARRKMRAAYRQGRYAGWYEVYLSEVRRYVYRPPRRTLASIKHRA